MKTLLLLVEICMVMTVTAFAIENEQGFQIVPMLQHESLILESQGITSNGMGLIMMGEDLIFVGSYTHHTLKESPSFNYPDEYHSFDMMVEKEDGENQLLMVFKSDSDEPALDRLNTYQAAMLYGFGLVKRDHLEIILGGGLAVGDFGIEASNGDPWPVIPVPFFRFKVNSHWIDCSFDFITGPSLDLVFFPQSKLQVAGEMRMDQFRDDRDVLAEAAIRYRFFNQDQTEDDFAGVALGIKNDNYGAFGLHRSYEESLEIHYKTIFAELDLSLIKITGGHAFHGRELYGEEIKHELGSGNYLSVQMMYQF